jgi:hypothetical protein
MLSRAAGRSAARPALIFSIAAVLLVERLLIPRGII